MIAGVRVEATTPITSCVERTPLKQIVIKLPYFNLYINAYEKNKYYYNLLK